MQPYSCLSRSDKLCRRGRHPKMRVPQIQGEVLMHPLRIAVTASFISAVLATAAFAAPTVYTTDANHTFVRFSYNHMGFSTQESRFNSVSGTVTYDPADKTGSVDIVINAKSVDTGSAPFQKKNQGGAFLRNTGVR